MCALLERNSTLRIFNLEFACVPVPVIFSRFHHLVSAANPASMTICIINGHLCWLVVRHNFKLLQVDGYSSTLICVWAIICFNVLFISKGVRLKTEPKYWRKRFKNTDPRLPFSMEKVCICCYILKLYHRACSFQSCARIFAIQAWCCSTFT